jgi:hypothetical protein
MIWIISLILAVAAVIGRFIYIPVITRDHFWILLAAWLILTLATALRKN